MYLLRGCTTIFLIFGLNSNAEETNFEFDFYVEENQDGNC